MVSRGGRADLLKRGARFAIAGGVVTIVYVGATTLFASVFGVPFQVALIGGFLLAVATHFTLQRFFVWRRAEAFALAVSAQVRRYMLISGVQYASTAVVTAKGPGLLGAPRLPIFLVWTAAVSLVNFVLFGWRVFHSE